MTIVHDTVQFLQTGASAIPGMGTIASAEYYFRPFVMLVLLAIVGALVGTLINLRAQEFTAEAAVHSVFPGIVGGAVYGGIDAIIPAASAVGILVAVALTVVVHIRKRRDSSEAGVAVVLTSFFSIGIIVSLRKADMSGQLEALMFGRLLEVTDDRLAQVLLLCAVAVVLTVVTWKEQVSYAFDPLAAQALGHRTFALDLVLTFSITAAVVSASTAVGILLVIGLLILPAATARLVAANVAQMVAIAFIVGIAGAWIGLTVATIDAPRQISPQAAVALSMAGLFFLAALGRSAISRLQRTGVHNA